MAGLAGVVLAPEAAGGGAVVAITGAIILAVFGWLMLKALLTLYDNTLGAMLRALAKQLDRIPLVDLGSAVLGTIDRAIMSALGRGLSALEWTVMRLFASLAWVVDLMVDTMVDLANATYQAVVGITHGEIPTQITNNLTGLARRVRGLEGVIRTNVIGRLGQLARRMTALEAELDRTFGLARRGIDNVADRVTGLVRRGLAGVRADVSALRRHVYGRLDRRIDRLEALVIGGAMTAAVLGVLARVLPWYRCGNFKRFNKWLCKAPIGGLDNLLGLLLIFTTSLGVVDFARILQGEVNMFAWAVREAVDDTTETGR